MVLHGLHPPSARGSHLKATSKYWDRHALPLAKHLAQRLLKDSRAWRHGVVIPAYAEGTGLIQTVQSLPWTQEALGIIVINSPRELPAGADPKTMQRNVNRNKQSLQALFALGSTTRVFDERRGQSPKQADLIGAWLVEGPCSILALEVRLPPKQGVGYARRIGLDTLFGLWLHGRLKSPYFFNTDADVRLPTHFSQRLDELAYRAEPVAAAVWPFKHQNLENDLSIADYETHMRLYVAGLRHAQSPYAFHTIGSTICVSAPHYAAVRGIPLKQAGEDFYLLNKLAKVGPILEQSSQPILLSSRRSDRTPFGTGQALKKADAQRLQTYHPETYSAFKNFRMAWTSHIQRNESAAIAPTSGGPWSSEFLLNLTERIRTQFRKPDQRRYAFEQWLDAFRSRQWIHWYRDHHQPAIPVPQAVDIAKRLAIL